MLRRAVFSEPQRRGLERAFQRHQYISKPDRRRLASELDLKDSQVSRDLNVLTQCIYYVSTLKQKQQNEASQYPETD